MKSKICSTLCLHFLLAISLSPSISNAQVNRGKMSGPGLENAKALAHFYESLEQVKAGSRLEPVRVMHFGDSHIAADVLTRSIRERLQSDFGDGGPGFIVPGNPMATKRAGVISGATEGWVVQGIGGKYSADRIYGPAGINLMTTIAGQRAWVETTSNHFEVYFVREPAGGSLEVQIDGANELQEPLSLSARTTKLDYLTFDLPDSGSHRLELRTLNNGTVRLLGIVAERISPGVRYDVFGINGARANRLLSWNGPAFNAAIKALAPDLIILGFGTNELTDGDWTSETNQSLYGEILQRLRAAAPKASILIVGPPDRADVDVGVRLRLMNESLREVATLNRAAFWSTYDAMGGAGSMNKWLRQGLAQADRVHFTSAGYDALGARFYRDMMKGMSYFQNPAVGTGQSFENYHLIFENFYFDR
ncbi:MAG TPA: GDSL-type esterase/lipase family protein [Pyrinomonadaceae bacterium]|nr:GDSL-type esterase/lipase family protein [Pyrinomonadaceae bacterium]